MNLLMREQLIKFMGKNNLSVILNTKEKLCFQKLKETLADNKDLIEKFNLKKSLAYNTKFFKKVGQKISDIELKQEENLVNDMALQKKLQREQHLLLNGEGAKK